MVQLNDQHIPKVKAYAECNKFTAEAWNALLKFSQESYSTVTQLLRTSDENATYLLPSQTFEQNANVYLH